MKKKSMFLTVCFICLMLLGACGTDSPKKTVSDALDALKVSDLETANTYFQNPLTDETVFQSLKNAEDTDNLDFLQKFLASLQYEITAAEEEKDTAVVTATIQTIDISQVFSDYMTNAMAYLFVDLSQEELNEKLMDTLFQALEDNAENLTSTEVNISLVKEDGKWLIQPDTALIEALTGGISTLFAE